MANGLEQQKKAVACGHWPLYRFNPDLEDVGKNPLIIDSKDPSIDFAENRYRTLKRVNPSEADELMTLSQKNVVKSWRFTKGLQQSFEPIQEEK